MKANEQNINSDIKGKDQTDQKDTRNDDQNNKKGTSKSDDTNMADKDSNVKTNEDVGKGDYEGYVSGYNDDKRYGNSSTLGDRESGAGKGI